MLPWQLRVRIIFYFHVAHAIITSSTQFFDIANHEQQERGPINTLTVERWIDFRKAAITAEFVRSSSNDFQESPKRALYPRWRTHPSRFITRVRVSENGSRERAISINQEYRWTFCERKRQIESPRVSTNYVFVVSRVNALSNELRIFM